mmetsp:Transcript_18200/g.46626  ORF Transcript_18200/g.46626 Transcript_18200/m.46626 type:complete len:337 (-) Transcript_18200:264-1274(-)
MNRLLHDAHPDLEARLDDLVLLQVLRLLQQGLRHDDKQRQKIGTVDVDAQLAPVVRVGVVLGLLVVRDHGARKVQRVAVHVKYRLHVVDSRHIRLIILVCWAGERAHHGVAAGDGFDDSGDVDLLNEGLVALDVDDNVVLLALGLHRLQHLQAALRAVVTFGVGHDDVAPKGDDGIEDALVICGHHKLVQLVALERVRICVPDHRLVADQRQGLAREAGGAIARRHHTKDAGLATELLGLIVLQRHGLAVLDQALQTVERHLGDADRAGGHGSDARSARSAVTLGVHHRGDCMWLCGVGTGQRSDVREIYSGIRAVNNQQGWRLRGAKPRGVLGWA